MTTPTPVLLAPLLPDDYPDVTVPTVVAVVVVKLIAGGCDLLMTVVVGFLDHLYWTTGGCSNGGDGRLRTPEKRTLAASPIAVVGHCYCTAPYLWWAPLTLCWTAPAKLYPLQW